MEKIDDFVISLGGAATVVNPVNAPVVTSTPVTEASADTPTPTTLRQAILILLT